jgi:hypothetical protein
MPSSKQEKEIAITKMVVNIDGKDHVLSIAEARKLQAALNEVFNEKQVIKEVHHYGWTWNYQVPQMQQYQPPVIFGTSASPLPPLPIVTCQNNAGPGPLIAYDFMDNASAGLSTIQLDSCSLLLNNDTVALTVT